MGIAPARQRSRTHRQVQLIQRKKLQFKHLSSDLANRQMLSIDRVQEVFWFLQIGDKKLDIKMRCDQPSYQSHLDFGSVYIITKNIKTVTIIYNIFDAILIVNSRNIHNTIDVISFIIDIITGGNPITIVSLIIIIIGIVKSLTLQWARQFYWLAEVATSATPWPRNLQSFTSGSCCLISGHHLDLSQPESLSYRWTIVQSDTLTNDML